MAKGDIDGDGKADISISITQIVTLAAMFASIIGSYYTLSNRITIAEDEVTKLKYNQQEYTWKNQRKLEEQVKQLELGMRAFMKDIEYLQRDSNKKR